MPSGSGRPRARWVVVAAIFVVSTVLVLREHEIPATAFFGGDTWEYQSMAVNLAHGHGLKVGAILPFADYQFDAHIHEGYLETYDTFLALGKDGGRHDIYRTPAYPFLLGTLYAIVGVRPDLAMLLQLLVMIAIGSSLPVLGERIFGWRGFVAGIPAGLFVAIALAPDTLAIMTETMIAVACVLVLSAWMAIQRSAGWLSGILFGLSLAFALLVKGSLIFAPPLFIAYMLIRFARGRAFPAKSIVAVLLGLAVPVLAYSAWASARAERPVLLTTQGRVVLLDGHNEQVAITGDWSPQWKNDPASFHSRALRADPSSGAATLVARFYLEQPSYLPVLAIAKIRSAFRAESLVHTLATNLLFGLLLLHTTMTALRDVRPLLRYILTLAVIALGIATAGDPAICLTGTLVIGLAGLRNPAAMKIAAAAWTDSPLVGLVLLIANFLLLVIATFGDPRFIWPALFAMLLAAFYLAIRVLENFEVLPGVPLLSGPGRARSLAGLLYSFLRRSAYASVARELNLLGRYVDSLLYSGTSGDELLFDLLHARDKSRVASLAPGGFREPMPDRHRLLVLNGSFNTSLDIQALLSEIRPGLSRRDRVAVVLYNPYLRWLWALLDRTGLRSAAPATTFVTRRSLESLAALSGFQLVRLRPAANFPFRLLGFGTLLDAILKSTPLVRHGAIVNVAVLRPVVPEDTPPSLSVVIPARNEAGNIRAAIERMPLLPGVDTEVIFVEGGSSDDTAEEIRRVVEGYSGPLRLRSFTQTGKGKGDAVRVGFAQATGDLLAILDADLTMPPEMLPRFYEAYRAGLGDFVNGNRLLYPMEGEAMRFLNTLGNIFFCKALAWILESPLNDTLCGTKVLSRLDWARVTRWREDFGDFDPFGDFELLFSAATMGLGIVEVPVRYRARTYGETNIQRFRHGLMLAKMSLIGFVRIRMGLGGPATETR